MSNNTTPNRATIDLPKLLSPRKLSLLIGLLSVDHEEVLVRIGSASAPSVSDASGVVDSSIWADIDALAPEVEAEEAGEAKLAASSKLARRLTEEDVETIHRLHGEGLGLCRIASRIGASVSSVGYRLRKAGLAANHPVPASLARGVKTP